MTEIDEQKVRADFAAEFSVTAGRLKGSDTFAAMLANAALEAYLARARQEHAERQALEASVAEYQRREALPHDVVATSLRAQIATLEARIKAIEGQALSLQQRCVDWGAYWRAPDAHGVHLTAEQACELLRDVLGVETEITRPPTAQVPNFTTVASRKLVELQSEGWQVNGYALYRDGDRGLIDCMGFVGWQRQEAAQVPDGLPCKVIEADFAKNTVTLEILCNDWRVSAATYRLATPQPAQVPDGHALVPTVITAEMEAVYRNENDIYGSEQELHTAMLAAVTTSPEVSK